MDRDVTRTGASISITNQAVSCQFSERQRKAETWILEDLTLSNPEFY